MLDFGLAKALDPATRRANAANSPTLTAPGYADRLDPRHGRVHGAGAGARTHSGSARRYLGVRRGPVRNAGGPPRVRGRRRLLTLAAVLKDDVKCARLPADVPAPLQRLLRRCLERDPKRRLQAIGDARILLEELDERARTGQRVGDSRGRAPAAILGVAGDGRRQHPGRAHAVWPAVCTWTDARSRRRLRASRIVTPPTDDPLSFAISPDGRKLVFRAKSDSGPRLWLRGLDQTEASPLAGTDGGAYPFWSPEAATPIGFFADGKLKRVDIGGGVQTLADAPSTRGGTWGDGVILFVPLLDGPLMRVSPGGGPVTPVTRVAPGGGSHSWPQFLSGRTAVPLFVCARSAGHAWAVPRLARRGGPAHPASCAPGGAIRRARPDPAGYAGHADRPAVRYQERSRWPGGDARPGRRQRFGRVRLERVRLTGGRARLSRRQSDPPAG